MAVNNDQEMDEKIAYMKMAVEMPQEEEVPWYKSYPSAIGRGAIEATRKVGELMSGRERDPTVRKQQQEFFEDVYQKYLPTGNTFGPNAVQRGTEAALISQAFPAIGPNPMSGGPVAGRAFLGGLSGETVKELGGPPWMQTAAELVTNLIPDFRKQIPNRMPTQGAQQEKALIQAAERFGMKPEEYALTLNQRGPVKDFVKEVASKGGRQVDRFERTRQSLGRVWNNLRSTPEANKALTGVQSSQLINRLSNRLSNLPAEQRNRIQQDFNDLLGTQMRGTDIIDFWQKLNYYIPRGERALGRLKGDLRNALNQISPELGRDFALTNQLYGNFLDQAQRMGPNIAESLIRQGETGLVLTAVTTGNYPLLKKVLGPIAGRQVATELSTNPRFMNLSSKFINAVERKLPEAAQKTLDTLIVELGRKNAEAAMKLSEFDIDELFKALEEQKKEEE